jgi:UDP-glucuronate decarboxylase
MNTDETIIGPINLGNPIEFSILELTKLILRVCESKSAIEYSPLPGDDPRQRQPDITQAKKFLGWEPKIPLEEGLNRSLSYYKLLKS